MLPAREPEAPGRHSPGGIVCWVILGRDVMPPLHFRSASNLRHPVGHESVETSLLIEDVLQHYRAVHPKLLGLELHIQLSSQQSVLSRRQRGRLQLQARDRQCLQGGKAKLSHNNVRIRPPISILAPQV